MKVDRFGKFDLDYINCIKGGILYKELVAAQNIIRDLVVCLFCCLLTCVLY